MEMTGLNFLLKTSLKCLDISKRLNTISYCNILSLLCKLLDSSIKTHARNRTIVKCNVILN